MRCQYLTADILFLRRPFRQAVCCTTARLPWCSRNVSATIICLIYLATTWRRHVSGNEACLVRSRRHSWGGKVPCVHVDNVEVVVTQHQRPEAMSGQPCAQLAPSTAAWRCVTPALAGTWVFVSRLVGRPEEDERDIATLATCNAYVYS